MQHFFTIAKPHLRSNAWKLSKFQHVLICWVRLGKIGVKAKAKQMTRAGNIIRPSWGNWNWQEGGAVTKGQGESHGKTPGEVSTQSPKKGLQLRQLVSRGL